MGVLAVLTVCAILPAALGLFLIRGRMGGTWTRFWPFYGLGMAGLFALCVIVLSWASGEVSTAILACQAEAAADPGARVACQDDQLMIVVFGVFCLLSLAIYMVGGIVAHMWLRARRK